MIRDIVTANENIKPNSKEIQALKEHFSACFDAEGNFDLDRFKEYLSDKLIVKNEGYELRFLGKNYSRLLASLDTETVIEPDAEHNAKPENANSQNIYISGDNLDGLKQLLKSYSGSVKCIYIDPPYNTGSDGFVYNDKFNFTAEQISERLSISEEQAAKILDLARRGSASHSAWLMFMYPRLQLARDLLANDGVIFISIDDNEQANLKLICDDVFGEENFVGQITVVANPRGRDYGGIAQLHDYLLVYTKQADTGLNLIAGTEERFTMFDDKGGFELRELRNRNVKFNKENRPNLYYPFYVNPNEQDEFGLHTISLEPHENWTELYPLESQGINVVWRWGKAKAEANLNTEIKAKPMRDGRYMIVEKYREAKGMARSVWWDKDTNTEKGTLLVKELLKGKIFDYPKPLEMIERICEMGAESDGGDIILDFFSGSGTTAHAVMAMNAKDGGNRKYIMVQLQEPVQSGSEAEKAGYKTIDEIGIERIKRVAKKIREEYPDTMADLGFKHYTLREVAPELEERLEDFSLDSNLGNDIILDVFGEETVLTTFLVRDGYGFNAQYEVLDLEGYRAYYIKNHLYLLSANFSDEALAKLQRRFDEDSDFNPQNVVLFAYSFDWRALDLLKANLRHFKNTDKNLQLNFDMRY